MAKIMKADEIRTAIVNATFYEKLAMLKMSTCPIDILKTYAFPSLGTGTRYATNYSLRLREAARKHKNISAEEIVVYFQEASISEVPVFALLTLTEFFHNSNFSEQVFFETFRINNVIQEQDPKKADTITQAREKLLMLAVYYKGTSPVLLKEASTQRGLYTIIAKHPNISEDIAREIIKGSYQDTQLTKKEIKDIIYTSKRNMLFSSGEEHMVQQLLEIHQSIKLALIRNPKTSVPILIELIPDSPLPASKVKGLPELLRALLRALPAGAERNRAAQILLDLKKRSKMDPNSYKLLAHTVSDPELLKNMIYGQDEDARFIAAANPFANEEDKVFVALVTGGRIPKTPRIKTRFGI